MIELRRLATGEALLGEQSLEALIVFDAIARTVLYANAAATTLFGLFDDELLGLAPAQILRELIDATPRVFMTHLVRDGATREIAARLERLDSRDERTIVAFTARPIGGALLAARRLDRLESLWRLVVQRGVDSAEHVVTILREGMRGVGCDYGTIGRIEGDDLVIEYSANEARYPSGTRIPLAESIAAHALRADAAIAVDDVSRAQAFLGNERVRTFGIARFVSAPFRVGEAAWSVTLSSNDHATQPFDSEDRRYVDLLVDAISRVIARRDGEARINRLAFSDALTNLPNRAASFARLDETLAAAERHKRQAAVLFLDIDGFKAVNDTVGHGAGDAVLTEIADRLRATLRREEYVGRLGGDEFAIILPEIGSREEVEQVARRIANVLNFPFAAAGRNFELSASIGVAIYPQDGSRRDELLARADAAMYSAKQRGRAGLAFHEAVPVPSPVLRPPAMRAPERRDARMLLCYQPVRDVASGAVLRAEAFVRRLDPLHGLLAPDRILTSIRDVMARDALDRWVVREALTQTVAWDRLGCRILLGVNLASVGDTAFAGDLPPHADLGTLSLELAEDRIRDGGGELAAFVDRARDRGMTMTVDDATGSLALLQSIARYPIDAIKLEPHLSRNAAISGAARAVVVGTIVIANSFGWRVIAKGVETAEQADVLASLGCDGLQGYHVAHPMTAVDFAEWMRHAGLRGALR